MDHEVKPAGVLDTLGEEIIRIITPVSICMFLVVMLVSMLNSDSDYSGSSISTIATVAYSESSSDSIWDKLKGALLNSLVFVAVVTVATFVLVALFYFRCTKFLKYYMGFSAFLVLGFMGGEVALLIVKELSFPIDCVTFAVIWFNFAIVGVMVTFMEKMAIFVKQGYLVVIGMLVAYWFTLLPEWTTWTLLVAMSLYDLAAVLLPGGPLRLLVELAISRDEDIPALVYEARPVVNYDSVPANGLLPRRVWRNRRQVDSDTPNDLDYHGPRENWNADAVSPINLVGESLGNLISEERNQNESSLAVGAERQVVTENSELSVPLIQHRINVRMDLQEGPTEDHALERIGLGSSGAIKLGLGDFIFYSVLVGRAAMYDFMTVYACYLAIIAGLGITLLLLAVYQKALPALPVSVLLGVFFYVLTRLLLETFIVQCSSNLLMF